jgi:hypothetical protein
MTVEPWHKTRDIHILSARLPMFGYGTPKAFPSVEGRKDDKYDEIQRQQLRSRSHEASVPADGQSSRQTAKEPI